MLSKTSNGYYLGFFKSVFGRAYLITIAVGVIVGLAVFLSYGDVRASMRWGAAMVASISGLDYVMRGSNPERKSEHNRVLIFVTRVSLALAVAISI